MAARLAGWGPDWRQWQPRKTLPDGPGRFALYTLKALAFIHLRRDEPDTTREYLATLARLDPAGAAGWPVVAALADGITDTERR